MVGQKHVTNTLANALSSGRLVHAYLFAGPRGTGKTSTARILAKAINCVEGPTATPCNVCDACVSISAGTALDVIEIDAASNRRIDEIRDLLEKIPFAPTALRSKVYIIDEVHQLTPEASSALLKTLEEPPAHVVFVLATTESHKILPTIISRCQRYDFSLVATPEISKLLEHIASHEGIDIEPEALAMLAENAHGSVRDAIGVMDQISNLAEERITIHQVAELLGAVETELVFEMVDMIAARDTAGALSLVGRMTDSGKDPRRFTESLIAHLRSLFLVQNSANPSEIVEATEEHYDRLAQQAGRLRRHEVIRLIEVLGDTHRSMGWSEYPRLVLECALVKLVQPDAELSLDAVLFRVEELERRVASLSEGAAPVADAPPREPAKAAPRAREKAEGAAKPPAEKPAAAPAAGAGIDGEKARRAWTAVLAELRKQGQMRLYALVTKAKLEEASGGSILLSFPDEASFQMEALASSGEVANIEELWERLTGEPVKVTLTSREEKRAAKRPARPAPEPAPREKAEPPAGRKPAGRSKAEGKKAPGGEEKGRDAGPAATAEPAPPEEPDSGEVAKRILESFDGEIVEEEEEERND